MSLKISRNIDPIENEIGEDKFHVSEMVVRKYHQNSEFKYHYDDIIGEIFPHWFMRRKNVITCNVYFNDERDYQGGDLHFASTNNTFRPSTGDILLLSLIHI